MARIGDFVREFFSILLTIVSIIAAPLMVLLLPVYFLRFVVKLLAKIFRRDLGKMLSPRGNLFAVEYSEMFSKRTRCALYVTHMLDGNLDIEAFRKHINDCVVNRKLAGSGKLHSPELQQTITSWLGYLFWKWDEDFKIENHVKLYDGPGKVDGMTDENIPEVMKELAIRPFVRDRSPWEMWIWNNARLTRDPEQRPKSVLLFRVHHSMADGFAILRLLMEDVAKIPMEVPGIVEEKSGGLLSHAVKMLKILVKAPYQMISLSIHSLDFNEWHKPERSLTGKLNMAVSEAISVDYIKEIKREYDTSFHAVIQAAFAGAIRRHMIDQNMKVPRTLHCMIPLPVSGHPTKLRNHMTAVLAPLPVGLKEPRDRLYAAEKSLRDLRHSSVPIATFCMLPLVGALPAWVVRVLATNLIATCLLSIFPAPANTVYCVGLPVDDIMFGGGLLVGNMGLGFSSLSYDGLIRFGAGIDEGIYASPEHVKSLVRRVIDELHILKADNQV